MTTNRILILSCLLLMAFSGCTSPSSEAIADAEVKLEMPYSIPSQFFSFSHNLRVFVPANTGTAIGFELSNETAAYVFLGVKAQSTADVTVGFAVDIPFRDQIKYHPNSIPGDNATWATRAFGGIADEPSEYSRAIIFLAASSTNATFTIGLVHPDDYAQKWRAAESLNKRPAINVLGQASGPSFQSGAHWFIEDEFGIQSWTAGAINYTQNPTQSGIEFSWDADLAGAIALSTIYHIGVGIVETNLWFNNVEETSRFVYLQEDLGIAPAVLSGQIPGFDSGSRDLQCAPCQSSRAEGKGSFTGDSHPTAESITVIIVSIGQIPSFGWDVFGWPEPEEW